MMNQNMIIIFTGVIQDFNGTKKNVEWNIPSFPYETFESLINKLVMISGINPNYFIFNFNGRFLGSMNAHNTVSQLGLANYSKIQLVSFEEYNNLNHINNMMNPYLNNMFNNQMMMPYQMMLNVGNKNDINCHKDEIPQKNKRLNYIEESYTVNEDQDDYLAGDQLADKDTKIQDQNMFNWSKNIFNKNNDNNNYDDVKINNIPLNMEINIKFIKFSNYSAFNCQNDLNGILKLCLLKEISSKIGDSELDKLYKMKSIPDNIYFIMKILTKGYVNIDNKNEAGKAIKQMMEKENGCNIINFSNYVEEQIDQNWVNKLMKSVPQNNLFDIQDTHFRLGKYVKYMSYFENALYESMKQSVFEFSAVSLVILDREDFDTFERERRNCPNICQKILYHGTQIHPISCILTGLFRKSETSGYQHGKGVYFTDCLDYCWFYGGAVNNRYNINKIPRIGESFTAIASFVYYSSKGFLQVNDYKTRIQPGKNEVNFAYAGSNLETIANPDNSKFVGTEYVIWNLEQICPLISVKFKREEYCVIWRDDNFSEESVYQNEFDEIFKKFLKERIKYIKQTAKYNVYPCVSTNEALNIVQRKKYNKIILISNVGPDYGGKKFVDAARQIIGNDVIVLFLAYSRNHLQWITNYKNALFSNDPKFYEEYLDNFNNKEKMKELIVKLENYYKVKFNFDDNFLTFPLYKTEGKYSDLSF